MKRFLIGMLELFGVVFLRFKLIPRIWCVWLVGVNLGCLYFITRPEAQVVLGVTLVAVVAQTLLYTRLGFTRVMGTTHAMWLPMFAWMGFRLESTAADPALRSWLAVLLVTNTVSLLVDSTDAIRFLKGERTPHYRWHRQMPQ